MSGMWHVTTSALNTVAGTEVTDGKDDVDERGGPEDVARCLDLACDKLSKSS
jgi:hypothetical protein